MLRLSVTIFLVCSAALFSAAATGDGAQIYKWTDSQGVVHYSDKAPANPQSSLQVMALPELPPVDPKAETADQAWIADVNQWYQNVLKDQAQLEYEQLLASQASQSPAPPSSPEGAEPLSYVMPVLGGYYRFHRHRSHRPLLSAPTPQSFQNSLWHPQPNPFTQSLYKP